RPERFEDRLDRDKQRAMAYQNLSEMLEDPHQRVEAILAYGKPGNAIEQVSKQIRDHVEQIAGGRICVEHFVVHFPKQRGAALTPEHIDWSLRRALGVDSRDQPLAGPLLARAPPLLGDAARVLWLEWGVLRGQRAYADEVFSWLYFARDELAATELA